MDNAFLIVGQGIAGSLLAWELMQAGEQVIVVDRANWQSASMISAGILNPLTGQRLVIMPWYDAYYKEAMDLYASLGRALNQSFVENAPMLRIFRNAQDQERCQSLAAAAQTADYFKVFYPPGSHGEVIKDPFGSVRIANAGYCYASRLLAALRGHFKRQGALLDEDFDVNAVVLKEDNVIYKDNPFKGIIFAQGYQAATNPWFKHLPYNHVKGEILDIEIDADLPQHLICQAQWLLPLGGKKWRAGSNYNRDVLDCTPTAAGAEEIIQGVRAFIDADITVLNHQAAVRPVLIDQMPVLGFHPQFPGLGIFNGFGSKGFLMVPACAKFFVAHLLKAAPMAGSMHVARFFNPAK